jgi:5'(3')-deoxyribonucleotidase
MSNIIVDVDDTLLKWIDGFTNYLRIEHDLVLDPRDIKEWELSHWTGMSQDETYNAVQHFNRTDRTFANLKPLDDSQDIINNLHLASNKLTVITCCGNSCLTRLRRHHNLNKVLINII